MVVCENRLLLREASDLMTSTGLRFPMGNFMGYDEAPDEQPRRQLDRPRDI